MISFLYSMNIWYLYPVASTHQFFQWQYYCWQYMIRLLLLNQQKKYEKIKVLRYINKNKYREHSYSQSIVFWLSFCTIWWFRMVICVDRFIVLFWQALFFPCSISIKKILRISHLVLTESPNYYDHSLCTQSTADMIQYYVSQFPTKCCRSHVDALENLYSCSNRVGGKMNDQRSSRMFFRKANFS